MSPSLRVPKPPTSPTQSPHGRPRASALASLLALCAVVGCDRNIEPYQPGEEPRDPDLARIFPGPPAGGMGAGGGEGGAASAAADRAAFPPSRTEGAGTTSAADPQTASTAAAPISGRIELAPELEGERPAGAILFVIARSEGAVGGPPLAVLRIPDPEFPVEFEIGPGDVMIPSMRFEGPISLTARLDTDGNAMTRAATDLSSAAVPPAQPGTKAVELVLAQKG